MVCAPVFTQGERLATQVEVGQEEGMLHKSWITCDQLVSIPKGELTNYVGRFAAERITELNRALRIALDLP